MKQISRSLYLGTIVSLLVLGGLPGLWAQQPAQPSSEPAKTEPVQKEEPPHTHKYDLGANEKKGKIPPGGCVSLENVGKHGATICNTGTTEISYEVSDTGALTLDLGDGGSATVWDYSPGTGHTVKDANITVNGTGNCSLTVKGDGCTINNNLGGNPSTGSLNLNGSNNTVNLTSPGAPNGGTTVVNLFSTSNPAEATPSNPGQSFSGNQVVSNGKAGNTVNHMGYNAQNQPVVLQTIKP